MSNQETQETQKTQDQAQKPDRQTSQPQLTQETPRITATPTAHVKNPKRVAAGKKLAAYSKAAREQKKAQREVENTAEQPAATNEEVHSQPQGLDTITILTGIGVLVGIAGLYFTYRQSQQTLKNEQKEIKPTPDSAKASNFAPRVMYSSFNTPKSKLRSFD